MMKEVAFLAPSNEMKRDNGLNKVGSSNDKKRDFLGRVRFWS